MTVPADQQPRATVVVLAYNSERFMGGCLDYLAKSQDVSLEIICIDNASGDRSHEIAEKHPAVARAMRLEKNLGYSGGNNVGWRLGTAPLVVFINPDCWVEPDTLAQLLAPLVSDASIGACGGRLLYPNTRTIQHAGGILHPNAMCEHFGTNKPDAPEYREDKDVDYVTGALIAFRRSDLEWLGGFDEEYWPAYYEETDLCWRLRARGMRIRYVGGAKAYHYESPGLTKNSTRFVRTSYRSRMRFIVKNYSLGQFLTVFLPFELNWFRGPFARGFRGETTRSWASGAAFALKCLLRLSRRSRKTTPANRSEAP